MIGLPDDRKSFMIGFSRFDTIPACDKLPTSQQASHVAVASTALTTSRGYLLRIVGIYYAEFNAVCELSTQNTGSLTKKLVGLRSPHLVCCRVCRNAKVDLWNVVTRLGITSMHPMSRLV